MIASVEDALLDTASGLTHTQLCRHTTHLVATADPDGYQQRCHKARDDRRVEFTPLPDGMAKLTWILPAAEARLLFDQTRKDAKALPTDDRTTDQKRCDALLDRVLGDNRDWNARTFVTIPIETLMGLTNDPGPLTGYGPIAADNARTLALHGPRRGILLNEYRHATAISTTTYRPTTLLKELEHAHAGGTCTAPGCTTPIQEHDHITPWPLGHTKATNTQGLCTWHHPPQTRQLSRHPRHRRNPPMDHPTRPPPHHPTPSLLTAHAPVLSQLNSDSSAATTKGWSRLWWGTVAASTALHPIYPALDDRPPPPAFVPDAEWYPSGMVAHIVATTVDCADPNRLADFWSAVLGYKTLQAGHSTDGTAFVEIGPPDRESDHDGGGLVLFEQVPDGAPKSGKNRLHLDVAAPPGQYRLEVERILGLGATHPDIGQRGDEPWTVLADPEGNEFCVLDRDKPAGANG